MRRSVRWDLACDCNLGLAPHSTSLDHATKSNDNPVYSRSLCSVPLMADQPLGKKHASLHPQCKLSCKLRRQTGQRPELSLQSFGALPAGNRFRGRQTCTEPPLEVGMVQMRRKDVGMMSPAGFCCSRRVDGIRAVQNVGCGERKLRGGMGGGKDDAMDPRN